MARETSKISEDTSSVRDSSGSSKLSVSSVMLLATCAVVTLVIWKQLFFLAGILDMFPPQEGARPAVAGRAGCWGGLSRRAGRAPGATEHPPAASCGGRGAAGLLLFLPIRSPLPAAGPPSPPCRRSERPAASCGPQQRARGPPRARGPALAGRGPGGPVSPPLSPRSTWRPAPGASCSQPARGLAPRAIPRRGRGAGAAAARGAALSGRGRADPLRCAGPAAPGAR